jgi:hypothetical protein
VSSGRRENAKTIAEENSVADRVSEIIALKWHRNGDYSVIDFSFVPHLKIFTEIPLFAEVKCRGHAFGKHDSIAVQLSKHLDGWQLHEVTGVPVVLIIEWSDRELMWCDLTKRPDRTIWWGRTDRGDPNDLAPSAEISLSRFSPIEALVDLMEESKGRVL